VVETGGAVVLATPVSTEILESLGNEGYIGAHPNHLNQVRVLYEAKDWVLISFVIGSDAGGGLSGSLVTRACKVRWTKPISSCDDDCTVVVRGNSLRIEEGGRKTLLDLRTGEVLVPSLGINAVLLYVGLMVLCLVIGAAGGGLLAKITIGKVRTRELWVFVGLPVYCYLLTVVVNNSTLQSETPLLGGVAVLVISAVLGFIGGRKGPV